MLKEYLLDLIFIFFSINFFNIFIFVPLFLLILNIFFYYSKISFIKLNIYIFYYNIPLGIIYFLIYSVFNISIEDNTTYLFSFLSILLIYYIPLIYLLSKHVLQLNDKFSMVKCFIIFNGLWLLLYYFAYSIIK